MDYGKLVQTWPGTLPADDGRRTAVLPETTAEATVSLELETRPAGFEWASVGQALPAGITV